MEKLHIITSKPATMGILNIRHEKKIKNSKYSRDDIREFKGIKEEAEVKYVKLDSESVTKAEKIIELKETMSKANISIDTQSISTEKNGQIINLKAILETNSETKDLYKNPSIKFTFPKQMKKISAKYMIS